MKKHQFDFLSASPYVTTLSLLLGLSALVWIMVKGFNYGIDFAGGQEIQVRFHSPPPVEELRHFVSQKGFVKPVVQTFDSEREFLIRVLSEAGGGEDGEAGGLRMEGLVQALKEDYAPRGVEIRKIDSVGPQIGKELRKKGMLAIFYSLVMILIYVGLRFDYKFAPAAVICLFHDTILTLWIFTFFDLVVNVQTLAALLAIIGYSLNDTIVTFDRIRENTKHFGRKESFLQISNRSINDVLSRTILTSVTTLMAVGAMWIFTQGVIKDFAFTLGVGVLIGTYSSIYVATPLVVFTRWLWVQDDPPPTGKKHS